MTADLVFLKGKTPITNSLIIAEGTGNQHESVIRLIQKNADRFARWGKIYFSDLKSGNKNGDLRGRPTTVALLNEQQATFLVTLLRNTDVVLDFKAELVDQFYKMREILTQRQNEEWQAARKMTKIEFRRLTDTIRDVLIPLMGKEGASEAAKRWVYKNYVSMIQKLLNIPTSGRDEMPLALQYELSKAEDMARVIIRGRAAFNTASKQIYSDTKSTIGNYVQISLFNQRFLEV